MSIRFLPYGGPISSSQAISASYAFTTDSIPISASFAEYAVSGSPGPQGPPYITVNAQFP